MSWAAYRASDAHLIDPPDYPPTPSPENFADALDTLVADTDRLAEFLTDQSDALARIVQLYHQHGLPRRDKSERDDALLDQYTDAFDALLVEYRDSLGDTLDEEAIKAMEADAERARQDAAEVAADMRAAGY